MSVDDDYWERFVYASQHINTYSNASLWPTQKMPTTAEILENIRKVEAAMAEIPISSWRGCPHCGRWSKTICECTSVASFMPAVCYVCGAQHDPRVQAPRVCDGCRRGYLL
jgi:hypothetical protein